MNQGGCYREWWSNQSVLLLNQVDCMAANIPKTICCVAVSLELKHLLMETEEAHDMNKKFRRLNRIFPKIKWAVNNFQGREHSSAGVVVCTLYRKLQWYSFCESSFMLGCGDVAAWESPMLLWGTLMVYQGRLRWNSIIDLMLPCLS